MARRLRRIRSRFKRLFRLRPGWKERLRPYLIIAFVCLFLFIAGGGLYDITERPGALVGYRGGGLPSFVALYSLGDQTLTESIFSMVLLGIGVLGCWIAYEGTRYVYDVRKGTMYIIIGVVLIVVAVVTLMYILRIKLYGPYA